MSINLKLLVSVVLFVVLFKANAQEVVFSDMAPLPEARSAVSYADDGAAIYVANGFGHDVSFATEVYKLDVNTNTWSILTNETIPKRFGSAAVLADKLYLFNGLMSGGIYNDQVEVVDLNDGSISFTTNVPEPMSSAGTAVWNNKIYSFGGRESSGAYSDKVYEFDPQTAVWTELASMPGPRETDGTIVDGKLYAIGGFDGQTASTKISIYNISSNTWEAEVDMGRTVSAHAIAVLGATIYMVGDFANLNSLVSIDTQTNTLTQLQSNLNERRHGAAAGINGQLFAIGGNTQSSMSSAITSTQASQIVLSVGNERAVDELNIFPNPVTNFLTWEVDLDQVRIVDYQGRVIHRTNAFERSIDISGYQPGLYFLVGQKGLEIRTYRWVKE